MIINPALKYSLEFKKSGKKALKKLNYSPKDKKPFQESEKHKLAEYSTMRAELTLKSITKQNVD